MSTVDMFASGLRSLLNDERACMVIKTMIQNQLGVAPVGSPSIGSVVSPASSINSGSKSRCNAVTKAGTQCTLKATTDGLCSRHAKKNSGTISSGGNPPPVKKTRPNLIYHFTDKHPVHGGYFTVDGTSFVYSTDKGRIIGVLEGDTLRDVLTEEEVIKMRKKFTPGTGEVNAIWWIPNEIANA